MSYHITYGTVRHNFHHGIWMRIVLTGVFFCCFCWWVACFWPEGREVLLSLWNRDYENAAAEAAEVFSQELTCGFPLKDAFKNFCIAVFSSGHSS